MNSGDVRSVDINDRYLVSGSLDKSVTLYEYEENSRKYEYRNRIEGIWDDYVYSVKLSNDNRNIIVGVKDKNIYVLDIEGNPLNILSGHDGIVNSLDFIND